MQETGNSNIIKRQRITFRISRNSLSFTTIDRTSESQVAYEPYVVKSGFSIAVNLRDAFKSSDLLAMEYSRALAMIDADVMLIPIEEYDAENVELLYQHSFPDKKQEAVVESVMPDLNAVAVFSINKDLKLVLEDHYADIRYIPVVQPVWSYLCQRSMTGLNYKMYGYFHDEKLCVFSFYRNRFKFCNSFSVEHVHDAVYFLLYVWQQLNYKSERDELYLCGDMPDKEELMSTLKRYVSKAYTINATAEFNRAPITQIKGMPFDLITLFIRGK